jgi:hypothetical protein
MTDERRFPGPDPQNQERVAAMADLLSVGSGHRQMDGPLYSIFEVL